MPCLIPLHQFIAIAPTAMEEASIMASRALDLRLEVPTSIEDPGATMKPIHSKTPTHHVPREVGVATATRRSINPSLTSFVITLMPVWMPVAHQK